MNTDTVLKTDYIELKAPKIYIHNYPIDVSTLILTIIQIIILSIIIFGVLKIHKSECILIKPLLVLVFMFILAQLHYRRDENLTHITLELNVMDKARQLNILLLGSIIIFFSFFKEKLVKEDYVILTFTIIILLLGCVWYNSPDLPGDIRDIRNIYTHSYNSGIILFIIFMVNKFLC